MAESKFGLKLFEGVFMPEILKKFNIEGSIEYLKISKSEGIFYMRELHSDLRYAERVGSLAYAQSLISRIGDVGSVTWVNKGGLSAVLLYSTGGEILFSENSRGTQFNKEDGDEKMLSRNEVEYLDNGDALISRKVVSAKKTMGNLCRFVKDQDISDDESLDKALDSFEDDFNDSDDGTDFSDFGFRRSFYQHESLSKAEKIGLITVAASIGVFIVVKTIKEAMKRR